MQRDTIDYSFDRPNLLEVKAAGIKNVMRYLSPSNSGKNASAPEIASLHANDMGVGFVFEWYAGRAKEGSAAGVVDGHAALALAQQLGIPADVAIFAAIDYDAPESDQPALNDYIDGFASVLGDRGKAAYGGYYIIKRLFDAGKITRGWQTYAWSGGQWDDRAQLRQVQNGQTLGGAAIDYNDNLGASFWAADNTGTPQPTPPATTVAPSGTHGYAMQKGDTFWGLEAANNWTHGTIDALNPQWVGHENAIPIGTVIQIPGAVATAPPVPNYTPLGKHQIVAGDTFSGLDAANHWPQGTTQGLNPGLNPRTLQIGSWINVPAGGSTPVAPAPNTYKFQSGDTFWGLETAHGWAHGTLQPMNPSLVATDIPVGTTIQTP